MQSLGALELILIFVFVVGLLLVVSSLVKGRKMLGKSELPNSGQNIAGNKVLFEEAGRSEKDIRDKDPQRDKPLPARIFISYRRKDSADVTGRIYDSLVNHFGDLGVFKDVDSIPLGVDFREYLMSSISKAQIVLAVIGKQWNGLIECDIDERPLSKDSDFVRIEIESALKKNIPVIPVLVGEANLPKSEDLPDSLSNIIYHNSISIRSDPDFHNDMNRLISAIEEYLSKGRVAYW